MRLIFIAGQLSGSEVEPDRPQALVERLERELQDLAFGVAVLGDVTRIRRVERVGDQWQALDQSPLDDRRKPRRILADRLLQHLDAEIHMPRLVPSDGGEAPIETAVGGALFTHRFELETLAGQRQRRLDDDVIPRDALDEGLD